MLGHLSSTTATWHVAGSRLAKRHQEVEEEEEKNDFYRWLRLYGAPSLEIIRSLGQVAPLFLPSFLLRPQRPPLGIWGVISLIASGQWNAR